MAECPAGLCHPQWGRPCWLGVLTFRNSRDKKSGGGCLEVAWLWISQVELLVVPGIPPGGGVSVLKTMPAISASVMDLSRQTGLGSSKMPPVPSKDGGYFAADGDRVGAEGGWVLEVMGVSGGCWRWLV